MPGGRPSKLEQRITVRDPITGQPHVTTVAAYIVERIREGTYGERAARSANVAPSTYYSWLDLGGQARTLLAQQPGVTLTRPQRRHLEFLEAVDAAEAIYEVTGLRALEAIGLGQVRLETVTEKYQQVTADDGTVSEVLVERTVKRTGMAPSAAAIQWKLTRRFPERYQLRPDSEAADHEPDLSATRVNELADTVEQYLANMTGGEP